MTCKIRTTCRLCCAASLHDVVMVFTDTPPANEFVENRCVQLIYPLEVAQCGSCGHLQLCHVVDPELLFRNYVYTSGVSPAFRRHFQQYAHDMAGRFELQPNDFVIEIGSNDGTLLKEFKALGCCVLGIDPAEKIAEKASGEDVPTIPEFFTHELGLRLADSGGKPKLIVANNVFAHVDDLCDFTLGVEALMGPDSVFVFEVQYALDLVQKGLFDMVYHEHLSYHSIKPLVRFFGRVGLKLAHVEHVETHGGSIRCFVTRDGSGGASAKFQSSAVQQFIETESSLYERATYEHLAMRILHNGLLLSRLIHEEKAAGRTVFGFGAPAKTTTLMYHYGLNKDAIPYIWDDSEWKNGLLTPGLHVPVRLPKLESADPAKSTMLILAWNFAEPIMKRFSKFREAGGHFIVPMPEATLFE